MPSEQDLDRVYEILVAKAVEIIRRRKEEEAESCGEQQEKS